MINELILWKIIIVCLVLNTMLNTWAIGKILKEK